MNPEAGEAKAPESRPRILVVDDAAVIRDLVRRTLQIRSYSVVEAVDGIQALELLQRDPRFALMIVDLAMPRLDGLSLIHRIREDPGIPRFPIIVLSGEDLEAGSEVLRVASAFIQKPFLPSELLQTIQRLLQSAPAGSSEPPR